MTSAAIRQQLHNYIDFSDDKKIEALYTLLQNDMEKKYEYTEDELNMLEERAEKYLRGESKGYTVDEVDNMIREQRKKNGI